MNELFDDLFPHPCNAPFEEPRTILPASAVSTGGVSYKLFAGLPAVYILARHVLKDRCVNYYNLHKKNAFVYLADDIDPTEENFYRKIDQLQCTDLKSDADNVVGYFCLRNTDNCERVSAAYEEAFWREHDERNH